MFYISPQLTVLMLAVVPPVSLGAVSLLLHTEAPPVLTQYDPGLLRPLPQAAIQQNSGSSGRDDQGITRARRRYRSDQHACRLLKNRCPRYELFRHTMLTTTSRENLATGFNRFSPSLAKRLSLVAFSSGAPDGVEM